MHKRLFNYHKITRRWRRRMERGKQATLSAKDTAKSTRDFAWHRAKLNPYYEENRGRTYRLKIATGATSLLLMLGILLYHPFFHITTVQIHGLERINETELRNAVLGMMDYRKLFILPGASYALVNVAELHDILLDRFPLENVTIQKIFPNTLTINAQEKISTIIYDNGKQYSYLGTDGNIVEIIRNVGNDEWQTTGSSSIHIPPAERLKKEMGDFPIVYDVRGRDGGVNDVMLDKTTADSIITWFTLLTQANLPFNYIRMDGAPDEGTIKMRDGWDLKVKLNDQADAEFESLQMTIKSQIKRAHVQYIDVRYQGRVYWQ